MIGDGLETVGCIYVADHVDNPDEIDAAAVHPAMPVAGTFDGRAPDHVVPYWELSPSQRRGFLDALTDRNDDEPAPAPFLALMIMAIERRVFIDWERDGEPEGERELLLSRLRRIARTGYENATIRGHSRELLSALDLNAELPSASQAPPLTTDGVALRIGLARFAAANAQLPPSWAAAWVLWSDLAPGDTGGSNLSEARIHAYEELRELIELRYDPIRVVTPYKGFTTTYWAMHPALRRVVVSRPDLPDVPDRPPSHLVRLLRRCEADLLPLARALASRTSRGSLRGLALLPRELLRARTSSGALSSLADRLQSALGGRDIALADPRDLFPKLLFGPQSALNRSDSILLCELLGHLGFGIEPDTRFFGPAISAPYVCLFVEGATDFITPAYRAATLMFHLSAMMAAADGRIDVSEEEHLQRRLERLQDLTAAERQRLRAHLRWLLVSSPRLAPVMKSLRDLTAGQKREIGHVLVEVASADGLVSQDEQELLARLFERLEIPGHELDRLLGRLGPEIAVPGEPAATAAPRASSVETTSRIRDRRSDERRVADDRRHDALVELLFPEPSEHDVAVAFGDLNEP